MEALSAINFLLAALFAACYCYQAVFLGARLLRKRRTFTARKLCRYAVLIAARNESAVIAQLLESIRQQDYPQDLLDIYVVADNCTDGTASIAREHGARVFERQNKMAGGQGLRPGFPAGAHSGGLPPGALRRLLRLRRGQPAGPPLRHGDEQGVLQREPGP